ncbi:MAG TPA: Hsp20/alpha crystallin family protein [Blastocatellia bacterium]|nr:Hsp20/alpha crystallin family protein [Blastocatellia bacterium]
MPKPKRTGVFVFHGPQEGIHRLPSGPLWQPAADIYRTPEGWKIKLDLAGVNPEDLEVLVADDKLIVRGVRRDSFIDKGWSYYQLEITYSRFERVLQIPCQLGKAEVRSECSNGWLVLHVLCKD